MNKNLFYIFLICIISLMFMNHNLVSIIYGVCIFLYAMKVLNDSFSLFTGIELFLKKMTKNKILSFLFGFLTTTIMQSSGLVSVLAISFLSAGLISLLAGILIVYGANLGTTTGAWLVAGLGVQIDIAKYAMPMIVLGLFSLVSKDDKIKGFGYFLFSIGLLFMGISYMKSGFDDIKSTIDLSQYAMSGVTGLLVYTLIGLIVTVIMQSSHATLTLAITALSVSQISYENAVAVAIGSNVGSTIMAVIGSLNANLEGKKLTIAHLIFNIITALVALVSIHYLMNLTDWVAKITSVANDNYTIKLAIFHTVFNVMGVLMFVPFSNLMADFLNKFIKPRQKEKKSKVLSAIYLNDEALNFTDSALNVLILEVRNLYNKMVSILTKSISISKEDINSSLSPEEIMEIRQNAMKIDFELLYERRFKLIYSQIVDFAIIAASKADKKNIGKFMDIKRACVIMAETLKDMQSSRENFYKFMNSSNPYVKTEYDKLRIKLLKSLRLINIIFTIKDEEDIDKAIKHMKKIYHDCDKDESQIDTLIVNKSITNTMATSLMNDTATIKNITGSLLKIAQLIEIHAGEIDINSIEDELGVQKINIK